MRALLPLLTISLGLTLAASPAFAGNGHKAHKKNARSHDEAGARDNDNAHARSEAARNEAQANDRRADAARADAARSHEARTNAAHNHNAKSDRARAEAARRDAHRKHAARYYVSRHNPAPPPTRRVVVTNGAPHRKAKAPAIFANRAGQFSVGLTGGSLVSGYDSGASFGDFGLGLTGRYRATEGLGFEVSWNHFRDGQGERATSPLSLSAQAFAFPTGRVNPYALAGVSFTGRDFDDTFCDGDDYSTLVADDTLFGPHAGLGIEFAVGQNATINLEGRMAGYMNLEEGDPTVPVNIQGRAGFNFYF